MNDPLGGLGQVRSMLFVPAHRPEMVAKTVRWRPDIVVVDLEDAVPVSEKESARQLAVTAIGALEPPPGTAVLLRVHPVGSPWFREDVATAIRCRVGVVLPKLERVAQLDELRELLAEGGLPDAPICGGIETARGVADARELLAAGVTTCYFGAEDLIGDLGGRRTEAGHEVLYARSAVLLAARVAEIPAIDQAVVAVRDDGRFLADATAGRELGYQGKICVHPRQVELAHQVFTPSEQEIEHARAVLAAGESGAAVLDGEMIDEVHLRLARATLARAGT
jgi:citrate lyase subunit beta / citryl-CoA lyase